MPRPFDLLSTLSSYGQGSGVRARGRGRFFGMQSGAPMAATDKDAMVDESVNGRLDPGPNLDLDHDPIETLVYACTCAQEGSRS